jgi:hypothetical protein
MLVLSGGCSFIWGAELSDSPSHNGQTPFSKLTWPALWATDNNYEYDTAALCGVSNGTISRRIIDYIENIQVPDYVIVQWTYPNRVEFRFNNIVQGNYFTLNHWLLADPADIKDPEFKENIKIFKNTDFEKLASVWYNNISYYDSDVYYFLKEVVYLGNYLKNKKIKFVFSSVLYDWLKDASKITDPSIISLLKESNRMPWITFNNLGFIEWAMANNHFSLDSWKHPDEQCHQDVFNMINVELSQRLTSEQ